MVGNASDEFLRNGSQQFRFDRVADAVDAHTPFDGEEEEGALRVDGQLRTIGVCAEVEEAPVDDARLRGVHRHFIFILVSGCSQEVTPDDEGKHYQTAEPGPEQAFHSKTILLFSLFFLLFSSLFLLSFSL